MSLIEQIADLRVIMILGSGGVGKTSTSIALACAAARRGKKVALLSIDPAKRLASALGISLGSDLKAVVAPDLLGLTGSLDAAMLDQKAVFDSLVAKYAGSQKVADKIYANRLYQAASTSLAGPLEYLALAKLALVDESQKYDLIVVDTPPDTHALDFLQRPNLLNGFVENKVMNWMLKPFLVAKRFGLTKLMSVGERLMGSIAAVTGVQALEALAEFLVLIQEVIGGFHGSGQRVVQMLKRKDTAIFLVGVPSSASFRSLSSMSKDLLKMDYGVSGVIINRLLPAAVSAQLVPGTPSDFKGPASDESGLIEMLLRRKKSEGALLKKLADLFLTGPTKTPLFQVEELSGDLQTIAGLLEFVQKIENVAGRSP